MTKDDLSSMDLHQLFFSMANEIRGHVSIGIGFCEVALDKESVTAEERQKYIEIAKNQFQTVNNLIDTYLGEVNKRTGNK